MFRFAVAALLGFSFCSASFAQNGPQGVCIDANDMGALVRTGTPCASSEICQMSYGFSSYCELATRPQRQVGTCMEPGELGGFVNTRIPCTASTTCQEALGTSSFCQR